MSPFHWFGGEAHTPWHSHAVAPPTPITRQAVCVCSAPPRVTGAPRNKGVGSVGEGPELRTEHDRHKPLPRLAVFLCSSSERASLLMIDFHYVCMRVAGWGMTMLVIGVFFSLGESGLCLEVLKYTAARRPL